MEVVPNGEQAAARFGVLARTTMATVLIVAAIAALAITSLIQSNERATAQSRAVVQPAPSMADGAAFRSARIPARSVPLPSAMWSSIGRPAGGVPGFDSWPPGSRAQ